jgi:hypothetical protein
MMMKAILFFVCLAYMLLFPQHASAQTFPVDDSASQVLESGTVKMRWSSLVPAPGQAATITGYVTVLVRLDVSQWRNRQVRIYQKLPSLATGPVNVRWTANGPLLPGTLRDGERALVYVGPITSDQIQDTFRLHIETDGDRVVRPLSLAFSFEIEVEPTP